MQGRRQLIQRALGVATLGGYAGFVFAQTLEGQVKLVVGYAPGGGSDRAARFVAQALQAKYGIVAIVENRAGAGGRIAAQQMKQVKPSEDVLMLGNPAVMTVAPIVYKDNNYDVDADFIPLSQILSYDLAVAVGKEVPVRGMPHLIAWMRANPEKAFVGVPATGSIPHFFALMLGDRANVEVKVVGYKGSSPMATELVGGQIPVGIDTLDAVLPLHQSGKLRILAVSGEVRSSFAKDIPTLKESGIDLVGSAWNVFYAPRSMPLDRVEAYAKAIRTLMADPQVQKQFRDASIEPVSSTREQTVAMLKAYNAQWQPVVKRNDFQQ